MNILVIPTTDWIYNPNPNRLNFIFDNIVKFGHRVDVLHFQLPIFSHLMPRDTLCNLIALDGIHVRDQSLYYILNSPIIYRAIRKIVFKRNIDVIVSANIMPSFISNFMGVPVVYDYLDHWEESAAVCYKEGSLKRKVVERVVRCISDYNLNHADAVITVTEELRKMIFGRALVSGTSTPPVAVIPNGVDTTLLYPMDKKIMKSVILGLDDEPVIGYIGSLENWIDFEPVFKNLKRLNAKLVIVGSALYTSYEDQLKKRVAHYGIEKDVIFTGHIPYSIIREYISAMDIGLNPLLPMTKNIYSAGGKVFNYLACGVPVLSTNVMSLRQISKESEGGIRFYDSDTFYEIADSMLRAEQHDVSLLRGIAMEYDWIKISSMYKNIIEGVVFGGVKY